MMETEVKKILLIGRSGRGKSTLANVLLNKDDKFKEVFKESDGSISQTRNIQSETFEQEFIEQEEIKKINYRIIDTPGIGDTKLSKEEILDIIGEAVYLVRGGVNRVFFVTDGRFDKYETTAYDLLRKAIFDDKITNHTTIVRTKFRAFKNVEECQKDINEIEKSSDELKEIIKSCRNNIVHVDNPSMEIKGVIEEEAKQEIELNKNKRNESKKILLNHLKEVYQKAPYNPQGLEDLSKKVYERIEKKKRLRKALEKLEKQLKRVEEKIKNENLSKAIKDLNEEIEKESKAIHQTIFEHIQSKVGNNKIKELSENSEELSISRKKLSKPKATLSEFNFAFKLPGISFKAEYQRKKNFWEKEENLDEESVSGVNKSEKDAKLSDEIGEIITNLTKEEK
ncbi:3186_t:CDS:1 [Funneliformis geosporum]|nr:3186_t:CDS:1 [Funneliformis geosporum]